MGKNDRRAIILTFCCGIVTGVYLYFAGFMQLDRPDLSFDRPTFTIEAQSYGGCVRGGGTCSAWRLDSDGSYRLVPGTQSGEVVEPVEGALSDSLRAKLQAVMRPDMLASAAAPEENTSCESHVDGIDLRFEVTLSSVEAPFVLDTCQTTLSDAPQLSQTLQAVWEEIEGSQQDG